MDELYRLVDKVLERYEPIRAFPALTLESILEADEWARNQARIEADRLNNVIGLPAWKVSNTLSKSQPRP